MNDLTEALQLNPQVSLRPVADYPRSVRERLNGAEDDYVVFERRSRFSAIRVSATTADMLKLFEAPRLVGEAVLELSGRLGAEPKALLSEAFPVLLEMRRARVLVTPAEHASEAERFRRTRLDIGDEVSGWRVVRILGASTETEIYELRGAGGASAALKLAPKDAPDFVTHAMERERLILPRLAARGVKAAPRLLGRLDLADASGLIVDWKPGRSLNEAARDPGLGLSARLVLARSIANAYAELHAAGVLHGDVHGGNVVAAEDGSAGLVDFGAAVLDDEGVPPPLRLGLVESFEPEAAAVVLTGEAAPDVTPAGEQYALADLLTLTLAGRPALRLPLEQDEALRAIVSDPPRPWDMPGAGALGGLETVIALALAKDPARRFPSLGAFTVAVVAEIDRAAPLVAAEPEARPARGGLRSAARAIDAGWGLASRLLERGLPHAPNCSIYYGAAGVALGLLRAAALAGDGGLLAAAQIWNRRAVAEMGAPEAFEGEALGVSAARIGRLSVLNNAMGLPYVGALIAHATGDRDELAHHSAIFAERLRRELPLAAAETTFGLDLAAGLPGLLLACLHLGRRLPEEADLRLELPALALDLRQRLLEALARASAKRDFGGAYLGAAHGIAGALYALIEADRRLGLPADPRRALALEALAANALENAEGVSWLTRIEPGASTGLSGWCHGGAGHIRLWAAAAVETPRYLALAEGAAEFAWAHRRHCGASLCCGGAGLALSYARLADQTGDERWRRRGEALAFSERADERDLVAPASLFRGHLGVELARLELAAGESAFPLMDDLGA